LGIGKVTLRSTNQISALLKLENVSNAIIDNIQLDGQNNTVTSHSGNRFGVYLKNAHNVLLHNINARGNQTAFHIQYSSGTLLDSIRAFNNTTAIRYKASSQNNILNNAQLFNNREYALHLTEESSHNSINNLQAFNNGSKGILADKGSNKNIFNNILSFNQSQALSFQNAFSNHLNNVAAYNTQQGLYLENSPSNKYYGDLTLFANTANISGKSIDDFTLMASSNPSIGRYQGTQETQEQAMDCARSSNFLSGKSTLFLPGNCTTQGSQTGFLYLPHFTSLYGSSLPKQKAPVVYDANFENIITSLIPYNVNLYPGQREGIPTKDFNERSKTKTLYTKNITLDGQGGTKYYTGIAVLASGIVPIGEVFSLEGMNGVVVSSGVLPGKLILS